MREDAMPDWREEIRRRLQSLDLTPTREAEIIDELAQHLDDRYRELRARGATHDDARAAALLEIEQADVFRRDVARIERPAPAELPAAGAPSRGTRAGALWQDTRYALRTLQRSPGFASTVLLAIALSIGPLTAIISVGNWLLWRPHPGVTAPSRLAVVWFGRWTDTGGVTPSGVSYDNQREIVARARTIEGMAGVQEISSSLAIDGSLPRHAGTGMVTSNFFGVLGVPMRAGRAFGPEDDRPPLGAPVAVIGEPLARSAFGSPERALGRTIMLNSRPFQVIGVAPAAFAGIAATGSMEVWLTGSTYPYLNHWAVSRPSSRGDGVFYEFVVRAAPGASFSEVEAELAVLSRALAETWPDDNRKFQTVAPRVYAGLGLPPLRRPGAREDVTMMLYIGGALLLIGCANVANLLVFRSTRRSQEVAVRKALGASRARLVQMQVMEGCILAIGGAAFGLALAVVLKQLIQDLLYPALPGRTIDVPIDLRVLGLTFAVALVTGLAASIVPAWLASRGHGAHVGRTAGRSVTGPRRLRGALASLQLGLSLTLLIGALLLVSTLRNLRSVEIGFDPSRITVFGVDLGAHGYTPERALVYHRQVIEGLRAVGEFEGVTVAGQGPFRSSTRIRVIAPGGDPKQPFYVGANGIDHRYFEVLSMPIVRGRAFTEAESFTPGGVTPIIVNEALALRLFGTIDAVGRSVRLARTISNPERDLPIVGVAKDARWNTLTEAAAPFLYQPLAHFDFRLTRAEFIVRSGLPARRVGDIAAGVSARVAGSIPLMPARTVSAEIDRVLDEQRLFAWMLSLLTALGFVLASLGLYGLVSQIALERRREFGIRLAVGARRGDILGLIARYALMVSGAGVIVGLGLSFYGSRMIQSMLFGVTRLDLTVYVVAVATLVVVVALACVVPALRALRVQPVEVLRAE